LIFKTSVVYAAAQDSQIEITSPDKLKNGESFNLTLTAKDGSPIAKSGSWHYCHCAKRWAKPH